MKLIGTQKTRYLLSQGTCLPKKAIVALNQEGEKTWKHLCTTQFRENELPLSAH